MLPVVTYGVNWIEPVVRGCFSSSLNYSWGKYCTEIYCKDFEETLLASKRGIFGVLFGPLACRQGFFVEMSVGLSCFAEEFGEFWTVTFLSTVLVE